MRYQFENVHKIDSGIWKAKIPLAALSSMANEAANTTRIGVAFVRDGLFDENLSILTVPAQGFDLLAWSDTEDFLLVDQTTREDNSSLTQFLPNGDNESVAPNSEFLSACRRENLPESLVNSVEKLLNELLKIQPFELQEGKARKWTAVPNFLALTIQNRNKQLLVSVKGDPSRMTYQTIDPKVSRPPYYEFHYSKDDQFADVLDAAKKSLNS